MNGHNFTPIQKALGTGEEYRQCQLCGQVAFVYNDPYFNMICQSAVENRENLRRQLQDQK